jgi:hypothetical protein
LSGLIILFDASGKLKINSTLGVHKCWNYGFWELVIEVNHGKAHLFEPQ